MQSVVAITADLAEEWVYLSQTIGRHSVHRSDLDVVGKEGDAVRVGKGQANRLITPGESSSSGGLAILTQDHADVTLADKQLKASVQARDT